MMNITDHSLILIYYKMTLDILLIKKLIIKLENYLTKRSENIKI